MIAGPRPSFRMSKLTVLPLMPTVLDTYGQTCAPSCSCRTWVCATSRRACHHDAQAATLEISKAQIAITKSTRMPRKILDVLSFRSDIGRGLAAHRVEFVVGTHVHQTGHAIRKSEKRRNRPNVPNIAVRKTRVVQRRKIVVGSCETRFVDARCKCQHRSPTRWHSGGAPVVGDLLGDPGVFAENAQGGAVRRHTILATILRRD